MKSKNKYLRFKSVVGDWRVFAAILGVFIVLSMQIAINANFPLPYDEQYHMTLIQFYSHQLSPFITSQPPELSVVGDATRYGSYLSHYLLSFPLRLTALFTSDATIQVLVLRLINIGFVVSALVLFRLFVVRLTGSGIKANITTAVLIFMPVTSLLAAHVNYDNLILLLFAGLLVAMQAGVRQIKIRNSISMTLVLTIVSIALTGCLVKFTFLPLAAAGLAFMGGVMVRRKIMPKFNVLNGRYAIAGVLAIVVVSATSAGLFTERYVGNMVAYKSLQPDCSAVQPLSVCQQYGPWARNYAFEQNAASDTSFNGLSIKSYVANVWIPLMIRGLAGVNMQGNIAELPGYVLSGTKVVLMLMAFAVLGALILLRKNWLLMVVVLAAALYSVALLQRNYSEFMALHHAVAVQGRYLIPLIIPLFAVSLMGFGAYADLIRKGIRVAPNMVKIVKTIRPDEAYDRMVTYWSAKAWVRETSKN